VESSGKVSCSLSEAVSKESAVTAYLIIGIDVHDSAGFQYLVRGGDFDVIEGDWKPHRVVLLRFPNRQAIRNFFADPEYAPLKALRLKTSKMIAVGIDGVA
jgi:uncharacterized protein (DUF1330 family)